MSNIVSYLWTIQGRKQQQPYTSTERFPSFYFTTADVFDVTLVVTYDDGSTSEVIKTAYITLADESSSLATQEYISHPKCYSFGNSSTAGRGWSENSGEHWIWPESDNAILKVVRNGLEVMLVWDMYDDMQYVIDPKTVDSNESLFKDKGVHPIETTIRLPEVSGGSITASISHQETKVLLRKERGLTELLNAFELSASLFVDSNTPAVETTYKINPKGEITFFYLNNKIVDDVTRQLELKTTESGYEIYTVESTFKTNFKSNIASIGFAKDYDVLTSAIASWYSRGNYMVDMGNGKKLFYYTPDPIPSNPDIKVYFNLDDVDLLKGPDDRIDSAVRLNRNISLFNQAITDGTIMFWTLSELSTFSGYPVTKIGEKNGWYLYAYYGNISSEILLEVGTSIFDLRILYVNIQNSTDVINEYVEKLDIFLPWY